jgi:hypothetical protein
MTKDKANPPGPGDQATPTPAADSGSCRYDYYCPHCSSRNIRKDALVNWNVSAQCWEIIEIYDDANCGDCGATDVSAVEVRL